VDQDVDLPATLPVGIFRVLPAGIYAGRARVMVERSFLAYRRSWLVFVSGLVEPLCYLLALGVGFRGLTAGIPGSDTDYTAFVAPALLAASAMNGAILDATFNTFYKVKFLRLYDAMLATPLGPLDVALGEIGWALLRGGLYATGFGMVMAAMGLVSSPWALLIVPAALLVAGGFAAVGMAATTYLRTWQDLELVQLVIVPMFLFSTTFFPLTVYPAAVRIIVQCFPLYHAIEIMRALSAGAVELSILGHAAYFVVMVLAGVIVLARRLGFLTLR
jgi:lipooligosaccharide transport system permease protein